VRAANAAVRQSKTQSILGPVLPSTLIRNRHSTVQYSAVHDQILAVFSG
jgi:hypothetical protein